MSEFEVLKELYSHGRTRVLLARHPNYKQRIVVKTTQLEGARLADRRLAIQEAHLLSNLKHPNIIRMLEFKEEVDSVTIIMEWAELGANDPLRIKSQDF